MTITNWSTYFDLIQDKYGAPYFTNAWKSLIFNQAILDFVNSHFPNSNLQDKEDLNFEQNQDTQRNLMPLVVRADVSGSNIAWNYTTGIINKANFESQYGRVYRILALTLVPAPTTIDVAVPIKYMRYNDIGSFFANIFKRPGRKNPRWVDTSTEYVLYPYPFLSSDVVTVRFLRYPVTVDIDTAVNCDLPDFTHNEIIARALEIAGVSSRDEALANLLTLQQQQK